MPKDRLWAVRHHLRAHHVRALLTGLVLLTAVDVLFGSLDLVLPSGGPSGAVSVPFRQELPIAFAALSVGTLHSAMATWEEAAAVRPNRLALGYPAVAVALSLILTGAAEAVVTDAGQACAAVRALVIWTGLAAVSGRTLGWRLSWLLPLVTVFPLTYLAQAADGRDRWWDWTGQPATQLPCWGLAVLSAGLGLAAVLLTPWRTPRPLRRWR